jgi:hypothetical protein
MWRSRVVARAIFSTRGWHVGVGEQRKRRDLAGPMASPAHRW